MGATSRGNCGHPPIAALLAVAFAVRGACGQIKIMTPDWLKRDFAASDGRIFGSTATFGAPFYGDEVVGRLAWGDSVGGHNHCTEDDYALPQSSSLTEATREARPINIVLVRRGKCSFTTKVKVAYKKGAHAVIMVDREDSALTSETIDTIIVGDDGFGDGIHIPSILVSKEDGARLIDATRKSEVMLELAWAIPTNQVVELDLWMSSGSQQSLQFLKDFAPKRRALNEVMRFQPHYAVFTMPAADPSVYAGLCSDTTGKYCAEDPDGSGRVSGRDVLEEDVRQLCIHEVHKVSRAPLLNFPQHDPSAGISDVEYAKAFWDYAERLVDECPVGAEHPQDRLGEECSMRLMRRVDVDVDEVVECVRRTKRQKLEEQLRNTAWSATALRINGWRYSGMLDADLVTRAVCAGFAARPPECEGLLRPRDPFEVYAGHQGRDAVSLSLFVAGLGALMMVLGFAACCYRRSMEASMRGSVREEVMLEVQAQMASYKQLNSGAYDF